LLPCETSGFHGREDSCCGLRGCGAIQWCGRIPMLGRTFVSPWRWRQQGPSKRCAASWTSLSGAERWHSQQHIIANFLCIFAIFVPSNPPALRHVYLRPHHTVLPATPRELHHRLLSPLPPPPPFFSARQCLPKERLSDVGRVSESFKLWRNKIMTGIQLRVRDTIRDILINVSLVNAELMPHMVAI